jgi:uncharacterized OsmC-like protein
MTETTTLNPTRTTNGIPLDHVKALMTQTRQDPAKGQSVWTVRSQWMGGARSDHFVDGQTIGGQLVDRRFTIRTDEPEELAGTNQYANPQEYLLAATNACMMVGYAAVAAMMEVKLTRLEVTITGDIDLRGFLGVADVPRGYTHLKQTVRISGDGTEEQFRKIHQAVQATSPNFWNITRPVRLDSELVIE